MSLEQHHIDELKRIHKEDFGEDLTDDEAWEMGHRLVNLFRLLLSHDNDAPKPDKKQTSQPSEPPPHQPRQQSLF